MDQTPKHPSRRTLSLATPLGGAVVAAMLSATAPVAAQDYTLTIVHTNDIHGRLEPNNRSGTACSPQQVQENQCFGGAARLATLFAAARAASPNTLVLDAGDQFQGTLFYTVHKARGVYETMNRMGYDAMVVGNHEFDDGPQVLADLLGGVRFPVLGGNVDTSRNDLLRGRLPATTIVERGGQRIGLVGVVTPDTPITSSPGPTLAFAAAVDTVRAAVDSFRSQNVTKVVVLSHLGLGADRDLARQVDGIDVIVGGHTHTLLSNTVPRAEGPYPLVERAPGGQPVLVVTSWEHGRALGTLQVTFDAAGVPVKWEGDAKLVDNSVTPNAEVAATVASLSGDLDALRRRVIGRVEQPLDGDRTRCRHQECTFGNVIADAILWGTRSKGVEVALQNGGGIRTSIAAGEVTMGQVLEALPFGNTIATFQVTGADLLAALEHGVSQAENPQANNTGRFLQMAGARIEWDATKPAGQRLVRAETRQSDGSWQAIDTARRYTVAFNNFNRRGGDGFAMFNERAIDPYDFGPGLDETVANFIAGGHARVGLDGRITRRN
ncbi:MAG: bifunctional metallophosphatase/5'-nucleotidase [Alphaproteobacteria bacterium]|nr:bifunctional metallophosphatase/5'-nucleotidase [Alphaproteobacteria bacterium]